MTKSRVFALQLIVRLADESSDSDAGVDAQLWRHVAGIRHAGSVASPWARPGDGGLCARQDVKVASMYAGTRDMRCFVE